MLEKTFKARVQAASKRLSRSGRAVYPRSLNAASVYFAVCGVVVEVISKPQEGLPAPLKVSDAAFSDSLR